MAEILSWLLFVMTIGFVLYWLITYGFLKLGMYLNVGTRSIEFFRLWLKPLFIINFSWFLIVELVFSFVYWTPFVLIKIVSFFNPIFSILNRLQSAEPSFFQWLFRSALIYFAVMIPYFVLQYKLSFHFKKTIFSKLAKSMKVKKHRFHGQIAKNSLHKKLYTQMATSNDDVLGWIEESLSEFELKPGDEAKRFSISNVGTDYMSWELNGMNIEFFESCIEFNGQEQVVDKEGKKSYSTALTKELFDGIIIIVKNVFSESWKPTLFENERIFIGKEKQNRPIHKQGFFIRMYNDIVFRTISTADGVSYNNSQRVDYILPEKIRSNTTSLFQYYFCDEQHLYLLLKTELENTAFDLNMNIPVSKSMELFKQDLNLVEAAVQEISSVINVIEAKNQEQKKVSA
jgi:hypothetical protein